MKGSASEYDEWLLTRPASVQALAKEFPIGTTILLQGKLHYHLGYTEDDKLILSPINPSIDYDGALESKVYVCAEHLRQLQ